MFLLWSVLAAYDLRLCGMLQCELTELVQTSVMESARVAFASSVHIERRRSQQKCGRNMDMIYACPLDCVECVLCECVHAAVQQQAVQLEDESLHTYTHVHAHTHGPAATGTADSTSRVTCVYTVASVPPLPELSG